MKKTIRQSVLWALMLTTVSALAQQQSADKVYLVRFRDQAVANVAPGTVRDQRVAQDPERWGTAGERVVAHVQKIEGRHRIKAEAVFGHVFKGMSARMNAAQAQSLRRDASVDVVEEEQVYSVSAQSIPWGISKTQATLSYTLAGNGSGSLTGVRAYIIDTGIDTNNTDLNRLGHVNFTGDRKNIDCHGHGTHVAGTVAAIDNTALVVGMAPGIPVYGVKVLNCQGSGTTTNVISGLDWVAANAVRPAVANMSLGGGASQLLDDAVRRLAASGVMVAVAAGNSAADACSSSPSRVGGGATAGVLTVAATDSNDLEASFSNYGACVDIWAPGVNVTSLKLGSKTATAIMSGTSMASPHVAGAAALYLNRYPATTAANLASTLKTLAVSTANTSKDGRSITRLNANIQ